MKQLYHRSRSIRRLFSSLSLSSISENASASTAIDSGNAEPEIKPAQKPKWRCFSYEEIHKATNGFNLNNLVGAGGYAEVFQGELENGQVIAVKRLTRAASDEQKEKEFLTELGTVGHVRHHNVTVFLGCCIDQDLHLIFEFSSRGSVSSNLHSMRLIREEQLLTYHKNQSLMCGFLCQYFDPTDTNLPPMEWKLRFKIVMGTARGLHYHLRDQQC